MRPKNFSGLCTVSEAGMWSTNSVVIRGSCKYCLISFVYSSSCFCGPAAAGFFALLPCAKSRDTLGPSANTSAINAPHTTIERIFIEPPLKKSSSRIAGTEKDSRQNHTNSRSNPCQHPQVEARGHSIKFSDVEFRKNAGLRKSGRATIENSLKNLLGTDFLDDANPRAVSPIQGVGCPTCRLNARVFSLVVLTVIASAEARGTCFGFGLWFSPFAFRSSPKPLTQIIPPPILLFNQRNLLTPSPPLNFFLPSNRVNRTSMLLKPHQSVHVVLLRESSHQLLLVLPLPTNQIVQHPNINNPRFSRHDVNVKHAAHRPSLLSLHPHSGHTNSNRDPRFCS